jgi:hypothetical protein
MKFEREGGSSIFISNINLSTRSEFAIWCPWSLDSSIQHNTVQWDANEMPAPFTCTCPFTKLCKPSDNLITPFYSWHIPCCCIIRKYYNEVNRGCPVEYGCQMRDGLCICLIARDATYSFVGGSKASLQLHINSRNMQQSRTCVDIQIMDCITR